MRFIINLRKLKDILIIVDYFLIHIPDILSFHSKNTHLYIFKAPKQVLQR